MNMMVFEWSGTATQSLEIVRVLRNSMRDLDVELIGVDSDMCRSMWKTYCVEIFA